MRAWPCVVCFLLLFTLRSSEAQEQDLYYCIEDYEPLGELLRNVSLPAAAAQETSGEAARACAAACDADAACTAFQAVGQHLGEAGKVAASCSLLTNTTGSLPQQLQLQPTAPWPAVLDTFTTRDAIQLRSIAWLCMQSAAVWDAFGAASHELIHTGRATTAPNQQARLPHQQWCAFGTDVAGTNLQQYTDDIREPLDCDKLCANTSACTIWTFVAAQPGSTGAAPFNCFVKADPFKGQNGWTGPPKGDIWIPDSQVDCFDNLADWRELGLILSPAVKTVQNDGVFYTLFPERVTFDEASSACARLPNGSLAILDDRPELDEAYRSLLQTLPTQTAVQSAWVGAVGVNTLFNPAAPNHTQLASQPGGRVGHAN
eukprot:GHRQ01003984.1.p1 GENE.GHRQ01003984.1~~GHRQ01003984.1.p1  ORF type:complete len:373 (+),score=109.27 GHRQ01003984.1:217-1335(+)